MMTEWKKLLWAGWFWMLLAGTLMGEPGIRIKEWHQRWPWNGLVDIVYSIECPDKNSDGTPVDIRVSFSGYDLDLNRTVEMKTFTGDGADKPVQAGGPYTITWNGGKDCPNFHSSSFKIKAQAKTWPKGISVPEPPEPDPTPDPETKPAGNYLVIDLSGGTSAAKYPYRISETGPDLSSDKCRTTELWLREIPAGTFMMGSPADELGRDYDETQHEVTLTKPFYMGVFEVTQQQWKLVMGTDPSEFKGADRPVEQVRYDDIRGTGSTAGAGWPQYGHKVDAESFMGRLQAKTGLVLDLPTEAQWEYACRAGTTTSLNSGKNLTKKEQCPNMAVVGRYRYNGGESEKHARVGSYQANSWGLYDMHGNVWEWCLDWYQSDLGTAGPVTDPEGSQSGGTRVVRGGCYYNYDASACRSAKRTSSNPSSRDFHDGDGFRLACLSSVQ